MRTEIFHWIIFMIFYLAALFYLSLAFELCISVYRLIFFYALRTSPLYAEQHKKKYHFFFSLAADRWITGWFVLYFLWFLNFFLFSFSFPYMMALLPSHFDLYSTFRLVTIFYSYCKRVAFSAVCEIQCQVAHFFSLWKRGILNVKKKYSERDGIMLSTLCLPYKALKRCNIQSMPMLWSVFFFFSRVWIACSGFVSVRNTHI